jgi:hypothetical protein
MKLKEIIEWISKKLYTDKIYEQCQEIEWAHIYHDSIRGRKWLEELAIHPGRWAANYSMLYLLVRILSDYKPDKILEFGLGESSKIISKFLEHELTQSTHIIVEHDTEWVESFSSRFTLSERSSLLHLELESKMIHQFLAKSYKGLRGRIVESYNLYVIDGPPVSERYSRYDICFLADNFKSTDEFIIIMDDYNRKGEQDTAGDLVKLISDKGIQAYTGTYTGKKSQLVIVTASYRGILSV